MEASALIGKLYDNISIVTSPEGYKKVINRNNMLINFDSLNRMITLVQNDNAFEIRSEEDWQINGRKVQKRAKPIYVILPKYKMQYIDVESGNAVECTDLNSREISKALEYGIIAQKEVVNTVFTVPLYDIRDTIGIDKDSKYTINKPKLGIESILQMFKNITLARIEKSEDTYYLKNNNTLFIAKDSYDNMVIAISKYLTQYIIDNQLENVLDKASNKKIGNISDDEKQLIKTSLNYSIKSFLSVEDNSEDFDIINYIDVENILEIMNIIDILFQIVIDNIEFKNGVPVGDGDISRILTLRKAEAVLDILEANNVMMKLSGNT